MSGHLVGTVVNRRDDRYCLLMSDSKIVPCNGPNYRLVFGEGTARLAPSHQGSLA